MEEVAEKMVEMVTMKVLQAEDHLTTYFPITTTVIKWRLCLIFDHGGSSQKFINKRRMLRDKTPYNKSKTHYYSFVFL